MLSVVGLFVVRLVAAEMVEMYCYSVRSDSYIVNLNHY